MHKKSFENLTWKTTVISEINGLLFECLNILCPIGWIQKAVLMPVLKACLSLSGVREREAKVLLDSEALKSTVCRGNPSNYDL